MTNDNDKQRVRCPYCPAAMRLSEYVAHWEKLHRKDAMGREHPFIAPVGVEPSKRAYRARTVRGQSELFG